MTRRRHLASVAALGLAAVLVAFLLTRSSAPHRVSTVLPSAANLMTGQEIRVGRAAVGDVAAIAPVDHGRAARVTLDITDPSYWPLPRDTTFEIRFGGTVSFSNRYIIMRPGKDRGTPIAEDGVIATRNVKIPVEVDALLAEIRRPVRHDLKTFVNRAGTALGRAQPSLRTALTQAPPVLEKASSALRDLTLDQNTLASLVASTGSVVDAVDRSSPRVGRLLTGAGQTFDAVAAESTSLQTMLDRLPAALAQTRVTLAKADGTLTAAGTLARRLDPGVAELRRTSAPLSRLLANLRQVGPDAVTTLDTVRVSAPSLTRLLGRATSVAPRLESIGRTGTTQLDCIRPYTPEVVMLATGWADFMTPTDGHDRYIRANIQNFFPAPYNSVPLTPAQLLKSYPGLEYGFPRPPGGVADQPWFQPQCGAGEDALDPAKDQEAKTFKENQLPPKASQRSGR